jgi:hypothetical protein
MVVVTPYAGGYEPTPVDALGVFGAFCFRKFADVPVPPSVPLFPPFPAPRAQISTFRREGKQQRW